MKKKIKTYCCQTATHLAYMLVALLALSGCINEDISDCPPVNSKVWLNLSFTKHYHEQDGVYKDRFAELAQNFTIFIYDNKTKQLVTQYDNIKGPFPENYRMPVDLPAGDYCAIAMVNLNTSTSMRLSGSVDNMNDAKLELANIDNGTITGQFTPFLHGWTTFTIETEILQDINYPIELTRNDNRLNFKVKFRDEDSKEWCTDKAHLNSTRIYIENNVGVMNFKNTYEQSPTFTYIPTYLPAPRDMLFDTSVADLEPSVLYAELDMFRLMLDAKPRLRICRVLPDNSEQDIENADLMSKYLNMYDTQDKLDRQYNYDIEYVVECSNKGWFVVEITINGWKIVNNGEIPIQ